MAYIVQNRRPSRPVPPIPKEQITDYPWFLPTCSNRTNAAEILKSCPTITNGNFLVRRSENKNAKYTITLWFDDTSTHVRINQLSNGHYQLEFQSHSALQMPTFATMKELIQFYSEHEMKLLGHCQGFVKLKFNANILDYFNSEPGVYTYGS